MSLRKWKESAEKIRLVEQYYKEKKKKRSMTINLRGV